MNTVIGLIGAKAAGKTTAFNTIQATWPVQEITLAAKLKDVCAEVFNIPRNAFDSHSLKEKELQDLVFLEPSSLEQIFKLYDLKVNFDKHIRSHIGQVLHSPRQIAQYIGTEVLRAAEADIHCTSAVKDITKDIGVVTDMRFPNEFEFFTKNYPRFFPVYIQNLGAEIEAGKDAHASEAHLKTLAKQAVVTIQNNGGRAQFEQAVVDFMCMVTER